MRRRWTPAEDAILKERYGTMPAREIGRRFLPGRTGASILMRAGRLGLSEPPAPPWTPGEDARLRAGYGTMPAEELLESFPGRNLPALRNRAHELGLTSHGNFLAWSEYGRLSNGGIQGTDLAKLAGTAPNKDSSTGLRGVHRLKDSGKYTASIGFRKRKYHLGTFPTAEAAAEARAAALEALRPTLDAIKEKTDDERADLAIRAALKAIAAKNEAGKGLPTKKGERK